VPLYAILKKAVENQHRWRDVVLYILIERLADPPSGVVHTPFPIDFTIRLKDTQMLETLSVDCQIQKKYRGIQLVELAPCSGLKTIKLYHLHDSNIIVHGPGDPPIADCLPKLSTVVFTANFMAPFSSTNAYSVCWNWLSLSPHLERLELLFMYEIAEEGAIPVMELPNLQTLVLKTSHTDTIKVCEHLSFPSLTKLELDKLLANDNTLSFVMNLARKCHLTDLALSFCSDEEESFTTGAIQKLFQSTAELQCLAFEAHHFRHNGRSLLVSTLTTAFRIPDGLLPQLISLALGIDPSAFISADVVDISSGRDLILALRQRYPSLFGFELQFHIIGDDEEGLELEDKLCEDPDILGCATENFRIPIIDRDLSEAR